MNANALEVMVVPIVRGIFLVVMLGAAVGGLFKMCAVVAGAWLPERPEEPAAPARATRGRGAPDTDSKLSEDDLAVAGA